MEKRRKPKAVIYAIVNVINGKAYIGLTSNFQNRMYHHFNALENDKHESMEMQVEYNYYGMTAFSFFILHEISSMVRIPYTDLESAFIKKLEHSYNSVCKKKVRAHVNKIPFNSYLSIFKDRNAA